MMTLFFSIATIQQLPQALALRESLKRYHPNDRFVIGLCDQSANLPADFKTDAELITLQDIALPNHLSWSTLSNQYNPVEFLKASKPLFLAHLWQHYSDVHQFVYLDPTVFLYQPLTELDTTYKEQAILLTPHLLSPPGDQLHPDEKHLQNVGLFHSGFLALRRSDEANHFVDWWSKRVPERAYIDYCQAMCLDQLWLMLTMVFYNSVGIVKNPGWHVGLWNLPERNVQQTASGFSANKAPLAFINFDGLINQSVIFSQQTRFQANHYPVIQSLLRDYQALLRQFDNGLSQISPAYGKQPIQYRYPLNGLRGTLVTKLRQTVHYIETVYVPRKR
jgi:hypothetical protein